MQDKHKYNKYMMKSVFKHHNVETVQLMYVHFIFGAPMKVILYNVNLAENSYYNKL